MRKPQMKELGAKIFYIVKTERNNMLMALIMGIAITAGLSLANYTKTYSQTIEENIASQVVRFHVLANSDTQEDQTLKLYVKDMVLQKYKKQLSSSNSRVETLKMIKDNIQNIQQYAQSLVYEKGYKYMVTANLEQVEFPTKVYGDITLPAGMYTALRIQIGEAQGHNWWCVMYPPLCYVNVATGVVDNKSKSELKNVLTSDEYKLVNVKKTPDIVVKFKILEWWNSK